MPKYKPYYKDLMDKKASAEEAQAHGLFHIANELADLVEATKLGVREAKEANRLKRLEISENHTGSRTLPELNKELEDQA